MTDARTVDLLGGGGTLEYDPQAPEMTPEEKEALDRVRLYSNQQKINDATALTSGTNAKAYWSERSTSDRDALAMNHAWTEWQKVHYPSGAWNFSSLDWGLLPVAVVVVKDLVMLAGTGGLTAPNVAADFKNFKKTVRGVNSVSSAKDFVENVQSAQQNIQDRIARTKKVFTVSGDTTLDGTAAAGSVADKILGDPSVNGADIIANTRDLALTGDVDAQRGLLILARVARARIDAGLAPGQGLIPPKTADQAAQVAAAVPRTIRDLTDSEQSTMTGPQTWWQRFVNWLL